MTISRKGDRLGRTAGNVDRAHVLRVWAATRYQLWRTLNCDPDSKVWLLRAMASLLAGRSCSSRRSYLLEEAGGTSLYGSRCAA